MKSWEDDLPGAYKYKKKLNKSLTGKKYMTRSNGTSFCKWSSKDDKSNSESTTSDEDNMQRKMRMRVSLPEDYAEKLYAQKSGTEELDMELPEVKDYKTRKLLGDEDIEQEVYGINPYTHSLLLDSMPKELDWPLLEKHLFIEDVLLRTLNKQVRNFTGTGSGNTPMMFSLQLVIEENEKLSEDRDIEAVKMCQGILKAIDSHPNDRYVAYTKDDADGYDLVVIDAMHKANYASLICHSCRPNCEAKFTAVDVHC
nr:histone-lysine n-methyltransferase atxr3 [Quercus suber]